MIRYEEILHGCKCKGCLNRFVGCHATCLSYIEWRGALQEAQAEMIKHNCKDSEINAREAEKKAEKLRRKKRTERRSHE